MTIGILIFRIMCLVATLKINYTHNYDIRNYVLIYSTWHNHVWDYVLDYSNQRNDIKYSVFNCNIYHHDIRHNELIWEIQHKRRSTNLSYCWVSHFLIVMLSVIILSATMLRAIMLSVIMLIVVILSVVASFRNIESWVGTSMVLFVFSKETTCILSF